MLIDTVICFNFTASVLLLPNIWGNHNSLWIKKYALVVVLSDTAFVLLYFHSFLYISHGMGKDEDQSVHLRWLKKVSVLQLRAWLFKTNDSVS